ncbi:hypothetical protein CLNEO_04450 [Anaerotignum neopropionicum]|uniref:Uncharacterized protein n=1 Tax=Anaerotignum neopropionicum TaxID=36847 RepID=A0A136WIC9_9FIRM|nr:hypothetical protein CLNEO_03160 [Anaerotignum neopropionicum]KXL54339.1 hypothetical protein CLNEO_04450 [Anaerotignum neopropionicum]
MTCSEELPVFVCVKDSKKDMYGIERTHAFFIYGRMK